MKNTNEKPEAPMLTLAEKIEKCVSDALVNEKINKKYAEIKMEGCNTSVFFKNKKLGTVIIQNNIPTFQYTIE